MSGPCVTARRIGLEREPVAIIDGFAADPDGLRDYAARQLFSDAAAYYPGLRAALPPDYLAAQSPLLATVMAEVFGVHQRVRIIDASYALVTRAADQLTIEQRLPHVDALAPDQLALVHFLVPAGAAGTAFFRHRASRHETLTPARWPDYARRLAAEISAHVPTGYVDGDHELFQRTALIDGVYNRAILYRGNLLHSGAITTDTPLSADPLAGRLTITGFFATT